MNITREQFIGEVGALFDMYAPNGDAVAQLGDIDITTVSAPAGMGKDALIMASGIPRVIADTIREPRANNGVMERDGVEYEFRGGVLDDVLDEVKRGEYVQIGMGPGRNSFYGSRIGKYPSCGPVLMDLMTSQVDTMRQLPFRSVEPVFVVAPSLEIWQTRLVRRGGFSPEESIKRQEEATRSLDDALADERYTFILNDDMLVASSALAVFATTRERDPVASQQARNVANTILHALQA